MVMMTIVLSMVLMMMMMMVIIMTRLLKLIKIAKYGGPLFWAPTFIFWLPALWVQHSASGNNVLHLSTGTPSLAYPVESVLEILFNWRRRMTEMQ